MDYLLQISIGPVQDFISAARRTRDLWFGSNMLSEIAKATAKSVQDSGGQLIFPAPENDDDLKADSNLNVANVILAEFHGIDGAALEAVSARAKEAAQSRLKDYADKVYGIMKEYIVKDRWDKQIEDVIEFYCAWVPIGNDYRAARKNAARLLAARKNICDFSPNPCPDFVPKSQLDGLRESVLIRNTNTQELSRLPQGVRINPDEALDAIGLIKRVPTSNDDWVFPSVSRVALDTWIRGNGRELTADSDFQEICDQLVRTGALSRAVIPKDKSRAPGKDNNVYSYFPFDGAVLLEDRHNSMIADSTKSFAVKNLCGKVSHYLEHVNRPREPYVAFLTADGDKMGAALSAMKTPDKHRTFSHSLSRFALEARDVIAEHYGICVYTGGDDVMAFLPVDTALKCARKLYERFGKYMGDYGASLSVGIAIAHAMEDLRQLFQFGREAESTAKKGINGRAVKRGNDRNGLAISVRSRGNTPITVREQWKDDGDRENLSAMSLDTRLEEFAELFIKGKIPAKFPYELGENAKFYDNWPDKRLDALREATVRDTLRIFSRREIKLDDNEKSRLRDYITRKICNADTIRELADEMIAAQWIAFGMSQTKDGETA